MTSLGYGCAGEDCRNPVNWLLTHMNPPATISVCDDHYPVFAIGMLAAELGVDTGRLYDVIRKHVDREAKRLAAEAAAEAERFELPDQQAYERYQELAADMDPKQAMAQAAREAEERLAAGAES